jgi:hypothetical protein
MLGANVGDTKGKGAPVVEATPTLPAGDTELLTGELVGGVEGEERKEERGERVEGEEEGCVDKKDDKVAFP